MSEGRGSGEGPGLRVSAEVVVRATPQQAFDAFVDEIREWWPAEFHLGGEAIAEIRLERHTGGRLMQRDINGVEREWGDVIELEAPDRLVLAWRLGPEFSYTPEPGLATTLEVRCIAEAPELTRVELEHRHLERHGSAGLAMHEILASADGWPRVLAGFREYLCLRAASRRSGSA